MSEVYLEPTSKGKRNLFILIALGILLGGLVQFWLRPALFVYVKALPECEQLRWSVGYLICAICLLPGVALYGFFEARKLLKFNQFPLPGTWVLRRTPLQRGMVVRLRAYALIMSGLGMLLLTPYLAWQVVHAPFYRLHQPCEP